MRLFVASARHSLQAPSALAYSQRSQFKIVIPTERSDEESTLYYWESSRQQDSGRLLVVAGVTHWESGSPAPATPRNDNVYLLYGL